MLRAIWADPCAYDLSEVDCFLAGPMPRPASRELIYQLLGMRQASMEDAPSSIGVVVVVPGNVLPLRIVVKLGGEAVHRAETAIVAARCSTAAMRPAVPATPAAHSCPPSNAPRLQPG